MEGDVVDLAPGQALVYLGTMDTKRIERWFPEEEVVLSQHKTVQQELDELL